MKVLPRDWEQRLMAAEGALRDGDTTRALEEAGDVPPPDERMWRHRWSEVRARAYVALGHVEAAYAAWASRTWEGKRSATSLEAVAPADSVGASEFVAWLDAVAGPERVASLGESLAATGTWQSILQWRAAQRAAEREDWQAVLRLATAVQQGGGSELQENAAGLARRAQAALDVDPSALGILLPLSGAYARAGEQALRALHMSLQDAGAQVRLVVRDTEGSADKAAVAGEALVVDERVLAVWGPVGVRETEAAARVLAPLGVPLVALSPVLLVPSPESFVITMRMSPAQESLALVKHAAVELGVRRFAILWPQNSTGKQYAEAFEHAVTAVGAGAVLVASEPFEPASADFRAQAKVIGGALIRKGEGSSALFIPASPESVLRVLPFFESGGIVWRRDVNDSRAVQLLGPRLWNASGIVDQVTHLTEAAIFTAAYSEATSEDAAMFALRFRERFAIAPTDFEAEAYDAARLLLGALAKLPPELPSRDMLWQRMLEQHPYEGLTGVVPLWPRDAPGRDVLLLTIDRGQIRLRSSLAEERVLRGGT